MRHLALLLIVIFVSGCTTTNVGSKDSRTRLNFGSTGNVQVRSTLRVEVCTTGNDGYMQGDLHEEGRYCTTLGEPGAVHSDRLKYMSAPAHLLWVSLKNKEEWYTVTIPRCDSRRRGPCVAEEFDILLHKKSWSCVTRYERNRWCRTNNRYGQYQ